MPYQIPLHTFYVIFEDGTELKVDTDQRDQRRGFMLAKVRPDEDEIGALRAIAWAAARRLGLYDGQWPEFDHDVAWVVPDAEVGTVDPTPEDGADSSPP